MKSPFAVAALVALIMTALILYAGYSYALRDVCAAQQRFDPAAYAAIAFAAAAVALAAWGAFKRRAWPNILIASATVVVSASLAIFAVVLKLSFAFAEFAPEVRVSQTDRLQLNFKEGFRIKSLAVEGPALRWRIEAADARYPPLVQTTGPITLGRAPAGYYEAEPPLAVSPELPDGVYRVMATAACAYRPALLTFTIRQSRLVEER